MKAPNTASEKLRFCPAVPHENSESLHGDAKIRTDKNGSRYVELEVVLEKNSTTDQKRSIESLYNDLSPERPVSERTKNMSEEERKALKLREIKKQEMKKQKDQQQ
tara:strand:- start:123 stop:440 length:318 start_codon:yes stop_codon:yes gene_type:complete